MSSNESVISFKNVDFHYDFRKPILEEVSFNIRKWSKITIMWQNWAWKSTIFKLINWSLNKQCWVVNVWKGLTIATWFQVVAAEDKELSILEFFRKYYRDKDAFNIDKQIFDVLRVVNLKTTLEKKINAFLII